MQQQRRNSSQEKMPIKEFTIRPTSFFLLPFLQEGNVKKSRQNLNEIQNLEQTFHMSQGLYICDMSLKCDTSAWRHWYEMWYFLRCKIFSISMQSKTSGLPTQLWSLEGWIKCRPGFWSSWNCLQPPPGGQTCFSKSMWMFNWGMVTRRPLENQGHHLFPFSITIREPENFFRFWKC